VCKAKAGDSITLPATTRQLKLKVVGVVHKPQIMAEARPTIYLPIETLQAFAGRAGKVSRIMVDLKGDEDAGRFIADWEARLNGPGATASAPGATPSTAPGTMPSAAGTGVKMRSAHDTRKEM